MAPSFTIVVSCRRKSPLNFYLNIMQHLFNMVDNMIVQIIYIDHQNPVRIEGPRFYNLLLVDSLEAFLDIDIISYSHNYDTNEYYHIFLMQRDRHVYHDMQAIFDYCWSNNIVNCNIQFQNAQAEVYIYSYFPFTRTKCGNTEPQLVNSFIGDSWVNATYFHSKLKNFYGCPLVVSVRDIPPYVYLSKDKDGVVSYKGFEMDLMKHLAKRMNFSLDIRRKIHDDRLPPFGNGALKMLTDRTADIAFGFYRKRISLDWLYTTTFPHYQNNIITVIYLPAHQLNTFEVLSYPFPNFAWIGIAVIVTVIIIITRLMRTNHPQTITIFSMIACALGSPISREPNVPHSVLIYTSWLWFTFLIRTIYSGLLFHLFRNVIHTSLPRTLDEAISEGYRGVLNQFTLHDIRKIPFYQRSNNHSSIVLDSPDEFVAIYYLEQNTRENLYAILSQEFLIYFVETLQKPGLFYVMPEIIMQQQLCIYLPKHSFLINQFNEEIMDINSVGLFQFWAKHYINSKYLTSNHMYQDAKIEQDDLWGIYMICSGCYLVAFVIFLIEILWHKLRVLRRFFP